MTEHSGRFVLRIPPDLHARVRRLARERGVSLNEYCRTAIEYYTNGTSGGGFSTDPGGRWVAEARRVVGDDLEGVVLFGSQARGEARASSDTDLLVVVSPLLQLRRALYHRWDSTVPDPSVNPHFVHLPDSVSSAGSIWYEVALDGVVLHEADQSVSTFLQHVRRAIAEGSLRRRYVHGHPYWVKNPEVANV